MLKISTAYVLDVFAACFLLVLIIFIWFISFSPLPCISLTYKIIMWPNFFVVFYLAEKKFSVYGLQR